VLIKEKKQMHGIVSAPEPEAVDAGTEILRAGGNAVDAAVACAFVQGVVDPPMSSIAGWGTMQVYAPDHNQHQCIDFYGTAPAAARPDMWADDLLGEARDGWGFLVKGQRNELGYEAIATPGTLKGLSEAHERFGTLPWKEVVAPAIDLARSGYPIRPHLHRFLVGEATQGRVAPKAKMSFSETGRRLWYRDDGNSRPVGAIVKNPDLANTLEQIARYGAGIFYEGDIAKMMAEDIRTQGGLITREDLRNYRTQWQAPVKSTYRGLKLTTNNPPGGGLVLIELLKILENFDLASLGHNTVDYVQIVAEAMKCATRDKDRFMGDPDFVQVPVGHFQDDAYAADVAERIKKGERFSVTRLNPKESLHTTHLSVLDENGMAVSTTHSLGMVSGAITKGLGFLYNGAMGIFDPRPGQPGSIAPGKRRFTAACPTIVFEDDRPRIVIGAPGGAHIAVSVAQALVNIMDFKMTLQEAVSAPRFSATSDMIDVSNRIPRFVTRQLESKGYTIARSAISYAFAEVHAVGRDDKGNWVGGADPFADGMALAV
jgi:gamma-glutamyltranspeptidase/glutathione hydrolase